MTPPAHDPWQGQSRRKPGWQVAFAAPSQRSPAVEWSAPSRVTRDIDRHSRNDYTRPATILEDAGRLRTSTDARQDLQGERCLLRH